MTNPKVSVIVPVYNVEKYLSKCLDSIVNQTLKDIEIIVVNYGSAQKIKHYHMHLLPNYGTRPEKSAEEMYNFFMGE